MSVDRRVEINEVEPAGSSCLWNLGSAEPIYRSWPRRNRLPRSGISDAGWGPAESCPSVYDRAGGAALAHWSTGAE